MTRGEFDQLWLWACMLPGVRPGELKNIDTLHHRELHFIAGEVRNISMERYRDSIWIPGLVRDWTHYSDVSLDAAQEHLFRYLEFDKK